MAWLVTVFWRDIPVQIIAERGRGRRRKSAKIELPDRFAKAVDAAAMGGDASDTDSYLAHWRRSEPIECGENLEAEAKMFAGRLEAEYDPETLRGLIKSGGVARS